MGDHAKPNAALIHEHKLDHGIKLSYLGTNTPTPSSNSHDHLHGHLHGRLHRDDPED